MTDTVDGAIDQLLTYGRRLNLDGLAVGPAGNLSVRVGDRVIITPSQIPYEAVDPEDVCVVDLDGIQLDGRARPSSELPMHLRVYASSDARAVVHTHSPRAVAVSLVTEEIPAVHYCVLRLGGPTVRVAPYARFGSAELAESALVAMRDRTAAILQNHGTIAYGESLATAYERAQLIEFLAVVWSEAVRLGTPNILDIGQLQAVRAESDRRRYGASGTTGSAPVAAADGREH